MARRGDELREHILWVAKDAFLELGFERASMDAIAARAETSKRTLYAHFESKDKLFLAVVDLASERYLDRLGMPEDYSQDPTESVVLFCGRFLQMLLWEPALRTCRLFIAEAERLPQASATYYDAAFRTAHDRLATYLDDRFGLGRAASERIVGELFGRAVYPRLVGGLLGVEAPRRGQPEDAVVADDLDLSPIRSVVSATLPPEAVVT